MTLREDVCAHQNSLTLTVFIDVTVPCQESERSCIYVLAVLIMPPSTSFLLDFELNRQGQFVIIFPSFLLIL
jgi:hypothetical protein